MKASTGICLSMTTGAIAAWLLTTSHYDQKLSSERRATETTLAEPEAQEVGDAVTGDGGARQRVDLVLAASARLDDGDRWLPPRCGVAA